METVLRSKTWKLFRFIVIVSLLAAACAGVLLSSILLYAKLLGPPPLAIPQSTLYYAADGTVIGESNSGGKRYWVGLEEISPHAIGAVLAIEDRTFYEHHGFDLRRIGGAVLANLTAMRKVQGASTITQQYGRNLYLTMDKTWKRKLTEAFYSIRLEMNYGKDEILEGYLNTINYGHGAYGIEAASQFYFGKESEKLTLAESAMLAGIPKGPSVYSPLASFEKAKSRQRLILHAMEETGKITPEEEAAASSEKLVITGRHPIHKAETAPYYYDMVKKELRTEAGLDERLLLYGGLRVYTALDPVQQTIAEKAMADTIPHDSGIQIGFAAMEPETGFVTAIIGGRDYEESPFNRASQAVRQPGSTIKPLLYYAALERGFTPATMLRSEPTTFVFDEGRDEYSPHNFNSRYPNAEITMGQALATSDNVYAVKTHLMLGEGTLSSLAKTLGITTEMRDVPSLALGTSGVRVTELLGAYSTIANGGKKAEPRFIKRVEDRNGKVIYEAPASGGQILDRDQSFVLSKMMTGMFDSRLSGYASVTGASIAGQMSREYAGKSGSTKSDSWMAGFTPGLAAVVWTGYDEGKEITLSADQLYAKNVWVRFMEGATKDDPAEKHEFKPPAGVTAIPIDPSNGHVATALCPVFRLTYFVKGTEPDETCTDHILTGGE